MKKQGEPIRQHTVTSALLEKFTAPDGLFWIFDRKTGKYRRDKPDNATIENNFYTFSDMKGNKDYGLEKIMGEQIENGMSGLIEKINNKELPTNAEREKLAVFTAFQHLRTSSYRDDHLGLQKKLEEADLKIRFGNKDNVERMIRQYEEGTGKKVAIGAEKMMNLVKEGVTIDIHKESHLKSMIKQSEVLYKLFLKMDWFFLLAPKDTSFAISDNPFSIVGGKDHPPNKGVGHLTPNSEKALPLSSKICLMMINPGKMMTFVKVDKNIVRHINCRTIAGCKRIAISREKAHIEHLVKRTKIDQRERQSRFKVLTPFD